MRSECPGTLCADELRSSLEAIARGRLGLLLGASLVAPRKYEASEANLIVACLKPYRRITLHPSALLERMFGERRTYDENWFASRTAMLEAIESLDSHDQGIVVSIAHCKGMSIGVAAVAAEDLLGIGVDIERSERKPSRAVSRRIRASLPDSGESELNGWIRFEAAFKADPEAAGARLSDYRYLPPDAFSRIGATIQTAIFVDERLGATVGLATCRRSD